MLLFPLITIIATTVITIKITSTWRSPGAFFSLCWSFFILVPVLFAQDYNTHQSGLWFIVIFSMALSSGSVLAYSPSNYLSSHLRFRLNYKYILYIFFFFTLISLLGLYFLFNYATNLYSINNYNSGWTVIPNLIAVDRYGDVLSYPFIIKYSLYFIYPGNLLGGLLFGLEKIPKKIKIFLFTPLVASIILGIIEGARTSILLGMVLFFSGFLSALILKKPEKKYSSKLLLKFFIVGSSIIGSFIAFFIIIQWLRQGMDTIIVDLLFERIRAYFFGYLAAFTQWLNSANDIRTYGGFITFAGPLNLFGLIDRPLGFYEPINIANNVSTNIFTVFRGIIIDFSITGSIIIAFLIGYIFQLFFQKRKEEKLVGTLPLSIFYAFTLYSPLISIFHYNSIIFSWIVIFFPLWLIKNESLAYNS
jgi:oligosaccharide repeat unit polymerase